MLNPLIRPRSASEPSSYTLIPAQWTVGHTMDPAQPPAKRVPAEVPGAVQLDWARAENWPPYWFGGHFKDYGWMEDTYWVYQARVPSFTLKKDQRLFLVCGGVDYRYEVRINGEIVHVHEGMFTPFEIDCSAHAGSDATLEIVVFPAPKRPGAWVDRSQASMSAKPPVSYGWDWHPRLIPLGIWQDTYFEIRPAAHLRDAELRYTLDRTLSTADLTMTFSASTEADAHRLRWSLTSPDEEVVQSGEAAIRDGAAVIHSALEEPQLWWPHDQGAQPLYRFEASLLDEEGKVLDQRQQRIGFRRVRLVMHPTAWDEPSVFPKSRSHPPITIEINGRAIFAKGSNWVNPEIFPGVCNAETYRPLLKLARDAHMNLLRCWGGAPMQKESFFDLCDELGLLVWQEFPLACNLYPDDPNYLDVLDQESRAMISRGRRHASLVMWCGGNELFNAWSRMTEQSFPLRLLNRNCYDLDPGTPFIPTAPLDGMAHGDYRFRDDAGREVFQIYPDAGGTAYPEFGCPGPSPVDYLKTFIPRDELWPARRGTAWESHHAFDAWFPGTWLCQETQQHYFGEPASLEEMVARGEWLQCAGYQFIFEEARRQKPRCAMALNWCFNEPWPTAANNSLINWPAKPKPAYHAVAGACRPVLASARVPKFSWFAGEEFRAELWLLNDAMVEVAAGSMTASLDISGVRTVVLRWEFSTIPASTNLPGPELRAALPIDATPGEFELELTVDGRPELTSRYRLHLRPPAPPKPLAPGVARTMNL